jgi:hypothetical protein
MLNATSSFTTRDYSLDLQPTAKQAAILEQIQVGDRVITNQSGAGFCWERTGKVANKVVIQQLLARQWIIRPHVDGPLFDSRHGGRMTPRGQAALARHHRGP